MGGNSGEGTQDPSSSQGLKNGKEGGSTSVQHIYSKADDGHKKNDSDTVDTDSKEDDGHKKNDSDRVDTDSKEDDGHKKNDSDTVDIYSKEDDGHKKNDSGTVDSQLTKKSECTKEKTASPNCSSSYTKIIEKYGYIFAIIVLFIACFSLPSQDTKKVKMSLNKATEHIHEAIEQFREEFPSQLEHIWGAFSAGIKETTQGEPTKPSVFMLLYETEERTAICLAQKIGNMSTYVLEGDKSNPLLIIDGADLEHNETLAKDYGRLLEEYRPKVEEQRAMIINNLHKIPGTVAQFFHSLCDTVTPAVDKAVYLFTMKASGVSNRHNPTEVAEEELRMLWSDELDEDILNPLIARITDMTMMIRPEKNMAPC